MRWPVTLLVSTLLHALPAAPRALADPCPAALVTCGDSTEVVAADRTTRQCPFDPVSGAHGSVAFDEALGTSRIDFFAERVALAVADTFWFEGLSPGDSVKCRATLQIDARACEGDRSSVHALFRLFPGYTQTYDLASPISGGCRDGSAAYYQIVGLRIGDRLSMSLELDSSPGAGGEGYIATTLGFTQLPAGVSVRSCHGYHQDGPVPTIARTWGALKSSYR